MFPIKILILNLLLLVAFVISYWLKSHMLIAAQRLKWLSVIMVGTQIIAMGLVQWFNLSEVQVILTFWIFGFCFWGIIGVKKSKKRLNERRWFVSVAIIGGANQLMVLLYTFMYGLTFQNQTFLFFQIINYIASVMCLMWLLLYQIYYREQLYLLFESAGNAEEMVKMLIHESEQNEALLETMIHEGSSLEKLQHWEQLKQEVSAARLPLFSNELMVTIALHQVNHSHKDSWVDSTMWSLPAHDLALFVGTLANLITVAESENCVRLQLTPFTQGRLMVGPFMDMRQKTLCEFISRGHPFKVYKCLNTDNKRLKYNVFKYLLLTYQLKPTVVVERNEMYLCIEQLS